MNRRFKIFLSMLLLFILCLVVVGCESLPGSDNRTIYIVNKMPMTIDIYLTHVMEEGEFIFSVPSGSWKAITGLEQGYYSVVARSPEVPGFHPIWGCDLWEYEQATWVVEGYAIL